MSSTGLWFFCVLTVAGAVFVTMTLGSLPASVATNFGGAGVPHAWMARAAYARYLTVVGLLLPLLAVTLVGRHHAVRAGRWWLGSLLVGFALGLHTLILVAHRTQPPRLSTPGFVTCLGLFIVGLASWVVHWRRRAPPPA